MQHGRSSRSLPLLAPLAALGVCVACSHGAQADPTPVTPQTDSAGISGIYSAYLQARFAVAEVDMNAASGHFLQALAADPSNPSLLRQAFVACALDARPEARTLAVALPNERMAQLLLANDDAHAGRWAEAEQRFLALPHDPATQVLQPLMLAWTRQAQGHVDEALATLQPYEDGPQRAVYALHAAMIADLAGRTAEAGRLYSVAQTAYGGLNLRLAQILASWQARQKHKNGADVILRSLADKAPELGIALPGLEAGAAQPAVRDATDGLAEAYLALAASLRQQDSRGASLLMLRFALNLRPDFTAARLLLADAQEGEKQINAALATLAPIPANDPAIALVRMRRAGLVQHAGDSEAALRELTELAHDVPGNPLPLMQRGDVLREIGRDKDAIQAYTEALKLTHKIDANDWTVYYARAISYDKLHDWTHAQADLEQALRLAPNQPSVMNYLAYSLTEQGKDLPRARKMLEKAAALQPTEGAIVDSLGWVQLKMNQLNEAVQTLEHAVQLEPEDPVINEHLGDAYHKAGRELDAVYQWRRALTFHPAPADATALQAKLKEVSSKVMQSARQPSTEAPQIR